jgi:hypothetical protein
MLSTEKKKERCGRGKEEKERKFRRKGGTFSQRTQSL